MRENKVLDEEDKLRFNPATIDYMLSFDIWDNARGLEKLVKRIFAKKSYIPDNWKDINSGEKVIKDSLIKLR